MTPQNHVAALVVLGAMAGLFAGANASAQSTATRTGLLQERGKTAADYPELKKLADGVYVWSDVHPSGLYTTNDLIVITTDGVLVADGQKDPATTGKMIEGIRRLTSQPIKYVVIASEHTDHTGGNESFPQAAVFIASPVSQRNLADQATRDRPNGPKTIVPSETVADRRTLKMGATEIDIVNNGTAHTGGDIEVYLPASKIFFVSEVFSNHIYPNMRAAVPTEWIQTLKQVRKVDATWIIPGHGFIDEAPVLKSELDAFERAMEASVAEVTRVHNAGVEVNAALEQANWGPYRTWPAFDRNGQTAVQRIYDELDGQLK